MTTKKSRKKSAFTAADLPEYCIYPNNDYSDEWGNRLVELWCKVKGEQVAEQFSANVFRDALCDGIVELCDWESDFRQAAIDAGANPHDEDLMSAYIDLHRPNTFNLIPSNLYAEFIWFPGWNGVCLDTLLDTHGLRSTKWHSCYIEDIQPGEWLERFLKFVNVGSVNFIGAAIEERGEAGRRLAERCAVINFKVERDQSKPALMTPKQVITTIENAYSYAVTCFHCFINVKSLFMHDPYTPMRLSSKGKVHIGLHDFINGAGYMDSYPGEVIIAPNECGFAGDQRLRYGVNKVYGLYRPVFNTEPETIILTKAA